MNVADSTPGSARLARYMKLAIIGAGPIGLEAAVAAIERGFEAKIFERGKAADAVRQWGHVKMFSPFGMNSTARSRARLQHSRSTLPET